MVKLGVNIDHIATLRQARQEHEPDPVAAARTCLKAGADSIVAHLREDRRHIQDQDIVLLRKAVRTRFNLEMSLALSILDFACAVKPDQATLVPERRQEITTEGGLDAAGHLFKVKKGCQRLMDRGIVVSMFIDPHQKQIEAVAAIGAPMVEFHTGAYARAFAAGRAKHHLVQLRSACAYARQLGLIVNAGHGLNYDNVCPVAAIAGMEELNIGYSIVSRAVFTGLEQAVKDMAALIKR
ncbi:MAG: pyridoxine 5'-phosphate synthase [Candidatus Omnitrophica bacterium]|nr:pyridoxine 5'-phosphate synthase [Candidatus Omnitrophota bacterium]